MLKQTQKQAEKQAKSVQVQEKFRQFLGFLLGDLNRQIDRRLACTFLGTLLAILCHRHRHNGLLLSELGAFLLGAERGRAGTRRLSNLLHSQKWQAELIGEFLWQQGTVRVAELQAAGERPLVLWDESVLEKPESLAAERLCAVRSTRGQRLKRIKPG